MATTPASTVIIISAYDGVDYFNETKRGYSEDQAVQDILDGQFINPRQVLKITDAGCEDITAFVANDVARKIEADKGWSDRAAAFAEEFAGWDRPKPRPGFFDRCDAEFDRIHRA